MPLFEEDTPGWVRATVLSLAAAVVALVALVAFLLIGTGGDDPDAGPTPSPSGSSGATSSSTCGLPDGDQTVPTAAPADVTWEVVNGIALPRSAAFGPGEVSSGGKDRSCFAHSPMGAVFFALNGSAKYGKDQSGVEIAGFRMTDYTTNRATLDIAIRVTEGPGSGRLGSAPVVIVWSNGDWSLDPGSESVVPIALADLTGFVAFGEGA
ncbi:hypothetical protein [Pimelobacter sp. 30-1]|uniref:hypothetical protein n=1 Tax=Pimelobacter sp. 30-1 TaxID=2004991 RepID=UPI001C05D123|nr:hypothetical protein [Pimelobacter sp. 30-1]MBU2698559.1 hypothetical protein [Pimelobacter sp. 30-1]